MCLYHEKRSEISAMGSCRLMPQESLFDVRQYTLKRGVQTTSGVFKGLGFHRAFWVGVSITHDVYR